MNKLVLRYWPESNDKNLLSAWRLSRKDNCPERFPRNKSLEKVFKAILPFKCKVQLRDEFKVVARFANYCIVRMSIGVDKSVRNKFLAAVEKKMRRNGANKKKKK